MLAGAVIVLASGDDVIVRNNGCPKGKAPCVKLSNGVMMPTIAAGTWQYNSSSAEASVTAALSVGFAHIDTARDYSNQDGVAKALAGSSRDAYFLTTKIPGCGMQGISPFNCAGDTDKAFDDNLKQLGVDYVDLMLIHFPPLGGCGALTCGGIQKQWAVFEQKYKEGKARAIGVSNFCVSCFECLAKTQTVTPMVNQIQFHIGMGADPEGLISYCRNRTIVPQAYSPLGTGSSELLHGNVTTAIGKRHGKSSVQVALKWIQQKDVAVVVKSGNPAHLASDIELFDWDLDAGDIATLDAKTTPSGKPSFMCSS